MKDMVPTPVSSKLFRHLVERMPDPVFLIGPNRKILYLNPAAETLTGKLGEELVGKGCQELFGEDNDETYCAFEDFSESSDERFARRSTIRMKSGVEIPIEMCLVRVPAEIAGQPMVFGTIRDLSAVVEQEERQQQYEGILTRSDAMQRVFDLIDAIADTDVSVLIQGESGTGKELVSRAVHSRSLRKDGPFHAVNCGALTLELLDSEIFGHEKGAFTGAIRKKPGRIELAEGGTLFLDEVGDMPPALQVKLLRVLQEKKFERVGGTETLTMDARIIAATNIDLESAVRAGKFRQDLFFRLNVVPIHLPPLRSRPEDIELIANHYLTLFSRRTGRTARRFAPESMRVLLDQTWPGNVRELINAVEYAVAVSPGELILPQDLPQRVLREASAEPAITAQPSAVSGGIQSEEKQRILTALVEHGFKRDAAAKTLGLSRTTLWRRMKKHGLA
jgi:PAS domain S-box-containing protein